MKTVKNVITRGIFVMVLTLMAMTSIVMVGNKSMTGTKVAEAKVKIKIPKNAKKEEKKAAKKLNKSSANILYYEWKKGRLINLNLEGKRIKPDHLKGLTGLETFTVETNTKDKWDFSKCKNLKWLYLSNPKNRGKLDISYRGKIDISKNKKLIGLSISGERTPVKNLDLSKNTNLKYLELYGLSVSSLDLSKNTKLIEITLTDLPIKKLDLSKAAKLQRLELAKINTTDLDVSNLQELQELKISAIDTMTAFSCKGLSSLKNIVILDCNKMQTISVANCGQLAWLLARGGQLAKVNIENCPSLPPHGTDSTPYIGIDAKRHCSGGILESPVLLYDNKLITI